jgi:hypothetical protein
MHTDKICFSIHYYSPILATETCRCLLMYDKTYFISVHLFVSCVTVATRFGSFVSSAKYLNANTIAPFRICAECYLGNLMIHTDRNIQLLITHWAIHNAISCDIKLKLLQDCVL